MEMAIIKSRSQTAIFQNGANTRNGATANHSTYSSTYAQLKRSSTIIVAIAVLLLFAVYAWSLIVEEEFVAVEGISDGEPGVQKAAKDHDTPEAARELINKIKEATRIAGGDIMEDKELEEWHKVNPCRSRRGMAEMYDQRKYAKKVPANLVWEEVLQEYTKLHRTCLRNVGNFTDYFLSKNESTRCKFAVTDVTPRSGLGNKILVTVSSIMYAILTQRVILVATNNLIPLYTCEPFPGSTWTLDGEKFPLPIADNPFSAEDPWKEDKEFFRVIDQLAKEKQQGEAGKGKGNGKVTTGVIGSPSGRLAHAVTAVGRWGWQPGARFYCKDQQEFFDKVTWMYFTGCIYTLPKLFVAPSFRGTLEAIFPDRMASTWLLRSTVLPSDAVWDRVRRIDRAYLDGADRRVGLQVRYKDGKEMYAKLNDIVNERITDCVQRNNILPNLTGDSNDWQVQALEFDSDPTAAKPKLVKVFIASLFSGLNDHLSKKYIQSPTVTGETIGFVQVSQGQSQQWSLEEDMQAYTEILLLSFSDQLLVTPVSTFGGLAEVYGGLTPWYIEYREKWNGPSCQRAQTVDVCNQFTFKKYVCPREPEIHDRRFSDVVPYIKNCLVIDHPPGIQLISDFVS